MPFSEEEAIELYKTFAVPASGAPLFQAAIANLNPWTEAKVDVENPERGPLLITSGEKGNTAPWAIANASFKRQQLNSGVTEIVEIQNRGHALSRLIVAGGKSRTSHSRSSGASSRHR
jgi:non-heme chloroperoxidase